VAVLRKCIACGKVFTAKLNWVKIGKAKYCSRICWAQARKVGTYLKCDVCAAPVYRKPSALSKSKYKKYFCSRRCSLQWNNSRHLEEKSVNWKHGLFSYKRVLERSNRPKLCVMCGIDKDKALAVHHIDKNRKNNKLGNLAWLCHNCHFLVHHYKNEKGKFERLIKKND